MNLATTASILAKIAPDILDVVIATLGNPAAGLWKVWEKVRTNEAVVLENAERGFRDRVSESTKEEEDLFSTKQENTEQVVKYLLKEINGIAESSVKLHEKDLHSEVMTFYRSSFQSLLNSSLEKPPTWKKLAEIRTDLGLIRLKVLWAESQQAARRVQKIHEEEQLAQELKIRSRTAFAVHTLVFIFLAIYTTLIYLSINYGQVYWTKDSVMPIIGIPAAILLWSGLGSLANMLYKYYKGTYVQNIGNGLKWVLARPLVGILMGAVTYLILVTGLLLVGSGAKPQPELFWLFAFVGGFSDTIFEGAIRKVGLLTVEEKLTEKDIQLIRSMLLGEKQSNEIVNDTESSPSLATPPTP